MPLALGCSHQPHCPWGHRSIWNNVCPHQSGDAACAPATSWEWGSSCWVPARATCASHILLEMSALQLCSSVATSIPLPTSSLPLPTQSLGSKRYAACSVSHLLAWPPASLKHTLLCIRTQGTLTVSGIFTLNLSQRHTNQVQSHKTCSPL